MGIVIERVIGEAARKIGMSGVKAGVYVPSHKLRVYSPSVYASEIASAVYRKSSITNSLTHAYVLTPDNRFFHVNDFIGLLIDKLAATPEQADCSMYFNINNWAYVYPYPELMNKIYDSLVQDLTL